MFFRFLFCISLPDLSPDGAPLPDDGCLVLAPAVRTRFGCPKSVVSRRGCLLLSRERRSN